MTKVKICGIKTLEDIEIVNELNPDYIGFVFAKSKRQIDKKKALELKERLNKNIKVVGVFVNSDITEIEDICNKDIIDIIQLHGDEDNNYIKLLKSKCSKIVIKAVSIKNRNTFTDYNSDYLLLDNGKGGTGEMFNWEDTPEIKKPFFLAGGLNKNNVLEGIEKLKPFGVDTSSGVETEGKKDKDKIYEFIRRVRND
ncbi:phosphoribosylanthranilate isomerase [Miniphocaeibacter massiliensis]|uniref:phosphoribosylanthranilate isomerase n=1 Tax=Miniphocaeibacter massiliensis TaxID=2041841 RepID=UPI000C1C7AFF|nr:phosphoribosylanthranilate isomerase [Miniphocaeibacter massiliensis]